MLLINFWNSIQENQLSLLFLIKRMLGDICFIVRLFLIKRMLGDMLFELTIDVLW